MPPTWEPAFVRLSPISRKMRAEALGVELDRVAGLVADVGVRVLVAGAVLAADDPVVLAALDPLQTSDTRRTESGWVLPSSLKKRRTRSLGSSQAS